MTLRVDQSDVNEKNTAEGDPEKITALLSDLKETNKKLNVILESFYNDRLACNILHIHLKKVFLFGEYEEATIINQFSHWMTNVDVSVDRIHALCNRNKKLLLTQNDLIKQKELLFNNAINETKEAIETVSTQSDHMKKMLYDTKSAIAQLPIVIQKEMMNWPTQYQHKARCIDTDYQNQIVDAKRELEIAYNKTSEHIQQLHVQVKRIQNEMNSAYQLTVTALRTEREQYDKSLTGRFLSWICYFIPCIKNSKHIELEKKHLAETKMNAQLNEHCNKLCLLLSENAMPVEEKRNTIQKIIREQKEGISRKTIPTHTVSSMRQVHKISLEIESIFTRETVENNRQNEKRLQKSISTLFTHLNTAQQNAYTDYIKRTHEMQADLKYAQYLTKCIALLGNQKKRVTNEIISQNTVTLFAKNIIESATQVTSSIQAFIKNRI